MIEKIAQVDIKSFFKSPFIDRGIGDFVSLFLKGSFALSGIVLLFLLIFGGIGMIAGAGSGNTDSTARGQKAATSALIGFLIVLSAYWVVRLIEIITGSNFITNPGV